MGEPDLTDWREINSEINESKWPKCGDNGGALTTKFRECSYVCGLCEYIDVERCIVLIV